MNVIFTGIALGLVVSIPPGPNATLCMNLACDGVRRAVPLITSAALIDAAYSLLAASGILLASQLSSTAMAYAAPCFMLGTAILAWSPERLPPRAAIGVVLLNPATAAIWFSLSAVPDLQASSFPDLLLRPLPVALGTAAWFTLLAALAANLSCRIGPRQTALMQKLLAVALAGMGIAAAASLILS